MNDTMILPDIKSEVHREKKEKSSKQSKLLFFSPQDILRKHRNEIYNLKLCSDSCFFETEIYSHTFEKEYYNHF